MKKTTKTKKAVKISEPKRDRELPVTKRLLDLKIQEVKSDVASLRLEMKAGFSKIDAKFTQMDAKFTQMDAKFTQMDAKFTQMDARFYGQNAKFESLDSKITKMMIMMEDQNDRNLAAHDRNALIYQKILDNDSRFEKLEEHVFGIKQR